MPTEVEAKLLAADASAFDALLRTDRLGDADLGPATTHDEVDRYLDTADGRLASAGWACRLRTRPGTTIVSLKGPPRHGDAPEIHRREEVEGPADERAAPARWPPSAARDLLDELTGGAPLVERVRLEQRRTERDIGLGGRAIGVLSLDAVTVRRDAEIAGGFHVVEIEMRADDEDGGAVGVLDALVAHVRAIAPLEPDRTTKIERALAVLGR